MPPPAPAQDLVRSLARIAPWLCLCVASVAVTAAAMRSVAVSPQSLRAEPAREAQLAEDLERLFSSVAESVKASVVAIGTTDAPGSPGGDRPIGALPGLESIGSGFIIDPRGFILTNRHLIGEATRINVRLNDGREFEARIVESDASADVALVKIEAEGLQVLPMGDSKGARVGQWVLAIGSPFGLTHTVSAGIVSATHRSDLKILPFESYIQTDASINPGNSGGPLVNLRGEVIGINTAIFSSIGGGSQGIGFAVPIDLAKALAQRWIAGKRECFLGIYPSAMDEDMARYYGMERPRGAFLSRVTAGSPAAQAGLQVKDVILSFGGVDVRDENQLRVLVASASPAQPIDVEVARGSGRQRVMVVPLEKEGPPIQVPAIAPKVESKTRLLGLTVTPLEPRIAEQLGVDAACRGIAIIDVQPSSPASKKGLRQGDVIVEVNEKAVAGMEDLRAALEPSREVVMLGVLRGGDQPGYYFLAR